MLERNLLLHSLNPRQPDRFRDRFPPAGAKDDRLDALALAEALRIDLKAFRRQDPVAAGIFESRAWTRVTDRSAGERTRFVRGFP